MQDRQEPYTALKILKEKIYPFGKIEFRSDNILTFRPDIGVMKEYNLEIFKTMLEGFRELSEGVPMSYYCDNRYLVGMISNEEKDFINTHFSEFATKCAMATTSPVTRVIVNTYMTIYKPDVPIKLFKDEESAIAWLKSSS